MSDRVTEVAEQYLRLSAHIKELSTNLTGLRKELKKLDGSLLDEMRRSDVMEVVVNGTTLQRTNKLTVK
jgi:hypothetical protein